MILLVDADSLIFASCYRKRETPDDEPYHTDISKARNKFDEQFMSIVNRLEEIYSIDKVLTFSGSKGNFRKLISKKYKANRNYTDLPPLLKEMHQYAKKQYDSIYGYGVETGDGSDNVNYFKGKGKRFAEKYYADCHTKYQYTRKLYELFKEKYKSKAKEKYAECYHQLKLRTD